jgi:hypothetical protein
MPHLVQILLPLYTTMMGGAFQTISTKIRTKMTERFGGLTAYTRASAEGLWETGSTVKQDDIFVVEVMVKSFDRGW